MNEPLPKLMTLQQLGIYLGVSRATIWRLRKDGTFIPSVHIGGRVFFREDDVNQFIEDSKVTHEPAR